jgi:hypothetical protein
MYQKILLVSIPIGFLWKDIGIDIRTSEKREVEVLPPVVEFLVGEASWALCSYSVLLHFVLDG